MRFKKAILHPTDYAIFYSEHLEEDGHTDTSKRNIVIKESGNEQYDKATLLHELLHAILHEINYFTNDEQEEDFVRRLEPRLLALLQDNPAIFKYLISRRGKK